MHGHDGAGKRHCRMVCAIVFIFHFHSSDSQWLIFWMNFLLSSRQKYINGICHRWHCVSVSLFMNDEEMRQINRLTFEHTNYCINEILKIARSACSSTCPERMKKNNRFSLSWHSGGGNIAASQTQRDVKKNRVIFVIRDCFFGAKQKIYWMGTGILISNGMFPQELYRSWEMIFEITGGSQMDSVHERTRLPSYWQSSFFFSA